MRKILFILLVTFISIQIYSQEKKHIYVDENFVEIDFQKFDKKFQSKLFFAAIVENDTAVFKKLRYKEYFGKLDSKKKHQLNTLFQKRYDLDTTKTWLIHYKDTLPNIELMPKKSHIVYLDSIKKRHYHDLSYADANKIIPRELRKYKRIKNVQLLHFYNINQGFPSSPKPDEWLKDSNTILKRTFTDGVKMYRLIIIHPNGDFYVSSGRKYFYDEKKLFKRKGFNKIQKKWQMEIEKYN